MKTKLSALIIFFMFLFTGSAFAVSFAIYGDEDKYMPLPMSAPFGDQAVVDYVNSLAVTSYTKDDLTKYEPLTYQSLIFAGYFEDTRYYAFDFGTLRPDHFLFVQAGYGYLYENKDSKRYALLNFDFINSVGVSHISAFGGTPVQVPEPSTLLLFGAGIAGLALYRRKRS